MSPRLLINTTSFAVVELIHNMFRLLAFFDNSRCILFLMYLCGRVFHGERLSSTFKQRACSKADHSLHGTTGLDLTLVSASSACIASLSQPQKSVQKTEHKESFPDLSSKLKSSQPDLTTPAPSSSRYSQVVSTYGIRGIYL